MDSNTFHISASRPSFKTEPSPAKKEKSANKRPQSLMKQLNQQLAKLTPVKSEDKVAFFRLMATMINAGISLAKALKILEEQTENAHMKTVISDLIFQIENGLSFSEALGSQKKIFSDAQIGMVESGEATGRLNQALMQIALETEKSDQLNKKIKGAMIYPVTILLILVGALYAIMTLVMPKIKEVFDSLGTELPLTTQWLINTSDFMLSATLGLSNAIWSLLSIAGIGGAISAWKKTKIGRYWWTLFLMRLPVFGPLIKKTVLARFCRNLSTLIHSGISILKALSITAGGVGNPVYERRIQLIADDVRRGITMGENMQDDKAYFPAMVVGMITVAEQTAQIDEITGKLADYYEQEVDDMIKNLSRLMEPLIIVILGGTVGFLVISVMLPILQSSDLAFVSQ